MVFLWFLAFLAWPIAEIWVFVHIGREIGWLGAILLTFATSAAGAVLMRIQGIAAMNRFLSGTERGELPVAAVLDGMGIFIAGAMLMLPGFLSDLAGLALFIPPLRRGITAWLFRQFLQSPASPAGMPRGGSGPRPAQPGGGKGFRRSNNVVDAEFETLDPRPKSRETPPVNGPEKKLP